jgi:Holliday junction resolvase RusA-like endonuclease
MTFTITGKPHGKERPRMTRTGGVYTPTATREYETQVMLEYINAGGERPLPCGTQGIRIDVLAFYPIPKSATKRDREAMLNGTILPCCKPDADNVVKSILDGLNGVAYKDDSAVTMQSIMKRYSDNPRVEVRVNAVGLAQGVA